MDSVQLVLLGLPILLFCSDVVTLFAPQPPSAPNPEHQHRRPTDALQPDDPSTADASIQIVITSPSFPSPGCRFDVRSNLN
uniref:Secreted protein n=1 Tax=Arundo donax TaxID=35708 RepID=A0A0A9FB00_ARUDO